MSNGVNYEDAEPENHSRTHGGQWGKVGRDYRSPSYSEDAVLHHVRPRLSAIERWVLLGGGGSEPVFSGYLLVARPDRGEKRWVAVLLVERLHLYWDIRKKGFNTIHEDFINRGGPRMHITLGCQVSQIDSPLHKTSMSNRGLVWSWYSFSLIGKRGAVVTKNVKYFALGIRDRPH